MLIMLACRKREKEREINVVNVPILGPGPVSLPFPFHCWRMFRTSSDSHINAGMRLTIGLYPRVWPT